MVSLLSHNQSSILYARSRKNRWAVTEENCDLWTRVLRKLKWGKRRRKVNGLKNINCIIYNKKYILIIDFIIDNIKNTIFQISLKYNFIHNNYCLVKVSILAQFYSKIHSINVNGTMGTRPS